MRRALRPNPHRQWIMAPRAPIEPLESRRMFCGDVPVNGMTMSFWAGGAAADGLNADPPVRPMQLGAAIAAETVAANGLPVLNSLPGAPTAVFLDFDGHLEDGKATLPYDTNGLPGTFSPAEQADIREAWRHVASYFAMFNTNVTTVEPSVPFSWSMITNSNQGVGYSYLQFNTGSPGSFNPSGDARTRQSGLAHEVGHNFGLSHQSDYDLFGEKIREYSSGYDSLHGPLMGVDYSQKIHKWFIGHPSESPSEVQDDVASIATRIRPFSRGDGMRADDHPNNVGAPRALVASGGVYTAAGIIERITDVDAFSFTSIGGQVLIDVVPPSPSMLDAKVELYTADGALLAAADGSDNDQHLNLPSLPAGTFVAVVRSHGNYADLGLYDLKIRSLAGPAIPPETVVNNLPAPANIVLGRGASTGVTISWDPVAGAAGYGVERSSDGAAWSRIVTMSAGTTYTDAGTNGGHRYFYRLVSIDDANARSVVSDVSSIVTRPAGVSSLEVTAWRTDALILNWRDVSGETGYRVERQISATANTWATLATVPANVPSYTATGLSAGTTYKFRVTSLNPSGDSKPVETTGGTRLAAVKGLTFTAKAYNRLSIRWSALPVAASYRVERSTDGFRYDPLATVTTTAYSDSAVLPLREYFYRVVALNGASSGLSGDSVFTASPAAPSQTLPALWLDRDIGSVGGAGASGYAAGTFTVVSGGGDIWEGADEFHFTYQPLSGDGEIVARVATQEPTTGWAKAGVMVRETLSPGSRHAMMVVTPDNGSAFQYRSSNSGITTNFNNEGAFAPYWVRLVRQGNTLIGYRSATGTDWIEQRRTTIAMGVNAFVGLAVVPGDNADLGTVTFTNVKLSNRAPAIATGAAVSNGPITGRTATLSVLGADDHGEANLRYTWSVEEAPAGIALPRFGVNGTNAAKTVNATFAGAGPYVFRVTVTDSAGLTAYSTVELEVAAIQARIRVTPIAPVVSVGQSLRFFATVFDQFDVPLLPAPSVIWYAGLGKMDATGHYVAPPVAGFDSVIAEVDGMIESVDVDVVTRDETAPTLLSAFSTKRHGLKGQYDLPLNLNGLALPTVEPRRGGATMLKFVLSEAVGAVDSTLDASEFIITGAAFSSANFEAPSPGVFVLTLNLTGVTNRGTVGVTLLDLYDAAGNPLAGDADVSIKSVFGDVDGSGTVNMSDAIAVRAGTGYSRGVWKYLLDLDLNGSINSADLLLARRYSARAQAVRL